MSGLEKFVYDLEFDSDHDRVINGSVEMIDANGNIVNTQYFQDLDYAWDSDNYGDIHDLTRFCSGNNVRSSPIFFSDFPSL